MIDEAWKQQVYDEAYENALAHIRRRREDARFTVAELEGLLQSAYVNQGNDWIGRGALYAIQIAATIAAYEHVLDEWAAEEDQR
ncbi:MAG: hypothetical protein JXL80_15185 [Planctomycetes bacterium]|nr:hypothetical protein [Planctomycetota bacterium]